MSAYRIAIIGAGPAGSAAAISLARSGTIDPASIALVESREFPRAKVCGEFLSPAVARLVDWLLGPRTLARAGARTVDRFVIERGDRDRSWKLPRPAWALSRGSLDELLCNQAAAEGVRVFQPVLVRNVEYGRTSVGVRLADSRTLEVELVIHADGSGRFDPAGSTPCRRDVLGFKCHFRPSQPVLGVRIRSVPGGYIGTVQVSPDLATCAMVVSQDHTLRHRGDADAWLRSEWSGWNPATRQSPWLSCGVSDSGYVQPGHHRSIRIGNAAGSVEPIGGEGIGLALWAGEQAAGLLAHRGLDAGALASVQRSLGFAYRRRLFLRRPACSLASAALMRPGIVDSGWPLLGWPSLTIRPWYALTGKPMGG